MACPSAFQTYVPIVHFDEAPHERQTDPKAALGAIQRSLPLDEDVEHMRKQVGRNPYSIV